MRGRAWESGAAKVAGGFQIFPSSGPGAPGRHHVNRIVNASSAFTLLELLTVIGIMLVLSSLLLGALSLALEKARVVQCLNNQRNLCLAAKLYETDHGRLVSNGFSPGGADPAHPMWVQGYLNSRSDLTNQTLLINRDLAHFAAYIGSPRIYKCPKDKLLFATDSGRVLKPRSYGLNWYLGTVNPKYPRDLNSACVMSLESEVLSPAKSLAFVDVNPSSTCWSVFGISERNSFFMYPSSEHSGAGTLSYLDGHCESHKWRDPRTREPKDVVWHDHYEASVNNADLQWLQARSGRKP